MPSDNSTTISKIKAAADCVALFREFFPDNYRQIGNYLCPWHADGDESLQPNAEFLFCHAEKKSYDVIDLWALANNCGKKAAIDALAKRFHIVSHNGKPRIVKAYDYKDESGTLVFQVCRYEPKDFRQRRPDGNGGWSWRLGNTRRVLYRLPELLAASPEETVLLVEGEKDVETARELGFVATCLPGGAGKAKGLAQKYNIFAFLKGRTVWIIPDNDDAGRKHGMQVAETSFGVAKSVKILHLPGLPEKGDLTNYINEHGAETAKAKILDLASKTPEYRPAKAGPPIISCRKLMESKIEAPRWIIQGLVAEGLTFLVAKPKVGKSWLAQSLALSVARGAKALDTFASVPGKSFNLCLEDNLRRMRDRLGALLDGAEPPDEHLLCCEWPPFDRGGVDLLHKKLDELEGIRLIVIDTWQRFRGRRSRSGEDNYTADYADLKELHGLAAAYGIAILLVHHARKEASDDVVDSILGSTALSGAADTLMILKRKSRSSQEAVLYVSGRDLADAEHALTFEKGIWRYAGDPRELQLTAERREIRGVLRDRGKPMSPTQIGEICMPKKSRTAVHNLLTKMMKDGEVERAAGQSGRYVLPPEDEYYSSPLERDQPNEPVQQGINLTEF